jgi:hypothetical protein
MSGTRMLDEDAFVVTYQVLEIRADRVKLPLVASVTPESAVRGCYPSMLPARSATAQCNQHDGVEAPTATRGRP